MTHADITAYLQKKKKVVSSQCPATTADKTNVSLQVQILKMHFLFKKNKLNSWDYHLENDWFNMITFVF